MTNEFIEAVLKREKNLEDLGRKKIDELIEAGKLINIFLTEDELLDLDEIFVCYGEEMMKYLPEDMKIQIDRLNTIIQGYLAIMMLKSQEYQKKSKGAI